MNDEPRMAKKAIEWANQIAKDIGPKKFANNLYEWNQLFLWLESKAREESL